MLVMTTKRKHSKTREILDPTSNLTKLEEFCDDKPRMYPKFKALMELRQFVTSQ